MLYPIKSWPVGETWKYCIDYLHQEENLYCFAVKYSEPTRRKPVPRATASVYFYIHIHSKVSGAVCWVFMVGILFRLKPLQWNVFWRILLMINFIISGHCGQTECK